MEHADEIPFVIFCYFAIFFVLWCVIWETFVLLVKFDEDINEIVIHSDRVLNLILRRLLCQPKQRIKARVLHQRIFVLEPVFEILLESLKSGNDKVMILQLFGRTLLLSECQ